MAAQVMGQLREDRATYGEKMVLKLLEDNLPKEFTVYVECPLPSKRIQRFPDFIVLTNYGVIVLEVKDWVTVQEADRFHATILTRNNRTRKEKNPTLQARELAILLSDAMAKVPELLDYRQKVQVAWGYAVVFPNLHTSKITQLRQVWGEEWVLNQYDLSPDIINARLKMTLPKEQIHALSRRELDCIRAVINPSVLIEKEDQPAVILNGEQEKLVSEPVREAAPVQQKPNEPAPQQVEMFAPLEPAVVEVQEPKTIGDALAENTNIRLVRGIAGSGKSLVLMQRARYLAAQYPEWSIGVFTFNEELAGRLEADLKDVPNIKVWKFLTFCSSLIKRYQSWKDPQDTEGWVAKADKDYPIIQSFGRKFIEKEIQWIKDVGIESREAYLHVERKGRGEKPYLPRGGELRNQIYDVYEGYEQSLVRQHTYDWGDVPRLAMNGFDQGRTPFEPFDAILIDEAQDFAPSWIQVVKRALKPETGVLFMADDPAQSIFRYFTWKEKGVPVVGRTRHLRIPYRNTLEIYQAAYSLIEADEELKRSMGEEGTLIEPDLDAGIMRHGNKPILRQFKSFDEEVLYIRDSIRQLNQDGVSSKNIAVFNRRKKGTARLSQCLRGLDVRVDTYYAYKGLEFEVVFLCQLQDNFSDSDDPKIISEERRLQYMAMTRARQQLILTYQGVLPNPARSILGFVDHIC